MPWEMQQIAEDTFQTGFQGASCLQPQEPSNVTRCQRALRTAPECGQRTSFTCAESPAGTHVCTASLLSSALGQEARGASAGSMSWTCPSEQRHSGRDTLVTCGEPFQAWEMWLSPQMTQIPAHRILGCGGNRQIHTDYRVLWRKRDGAATLSRVERPSPPLGRLLLFF